MIKTQKGYRPIVKIIWVDSASSTGWYGNKEDESGVTNIKSIGILVREDNKVITISTSIADHGCKYCDPLSIPKCSIKSIKVIGKIDEPVW